MDNALTRAAFKDAHEPTVCRRDEAARVLGQSRPATADEVKKVTATALEWF
jgi:hypothetical protein